MELQNVRRIAVFKLRNIGDVLMMTPALRALRETFPEAQVTAIVNAGTEAMLAGNADVDDLLIYPRSPPGQRVGWLARLKRELRFLGELRRRHFDLTIGFTEGDRVAWSSLLSGARYRLGNVHYKRGKNDPQRRVYNLSVPSALPKMHEVEKHFHILEKGGIQLRTPRPGPLQLTIPADVLAWAQQEVRAVHGNLVVHVHPVARWLWKCWDSAAMAEVINWLITERAAQVMVTTGPVARERARAREVVELCRAAPRFFDGNLSLTQIAALSAQADIFLGVDTAPMHMAAAVGTPVVALFGPTSQEVWGPWTARRRILSHECPCNLSRKRACDWNQVRACLAGITPSEVKAAVDGLLAESRGRAEAAP